MTVMFFGAIEVYDFPGKKLLDAAVDLLTGVLQHDVQEGDPPGVLYPTSGGNIHEFTPVTDCAVLDLLSPPYNAREGAPQQHSLCFCDARSHASSVAVSCFTLEDAAGVLVAHRYGCPCIC